MNDVISTFPLLRLPNNAILETLKTMEYPQIYGISILSKKARNLVECLEITTIEFEIHVTGSFEVRVVLFNPFQIYFKLYQVSEHEPLRELETPGNINIQYENTKVVWTNFMSVKELLDHFQLIFHSSITLLYFGHNSQRFSLDSIHRNVKKMNRINIYNDNDEQSKKILRLFRPASFDIGALALDGCVPRDVLIQNLELLRTHHLQRSLEDLLLINAQQIDLTCRRLSVKTLNQFLRLWAKGSNFRMEWMYLRLHDFSLQVEELFRGLNYKKASRHRVRYFVATGDEGVPLEVCGGWDFWRCDGTQATVTFCQYDRVIVLNMHVWYDHCLVDELYS